LDKIATAIKECGGTADSDILAQLDGRSMLVRKTDALPMECAARGYISGSLWKEYKQYPAHGGQVTIHGVTLPVGLRESERLPQPIFTPATKALSGHDENISFKEASQQLGESLVAQLRDLTLEIYASASSEARGKGIIIADTKFEFGVLDDEIVWIDEALTPDSSRFWDEKMYKPGQAQASFDKQFVRDYLETLDWPKQYPGPELPPDVIERTAEKYRDAYKRITGSELS
jgi:phosphoribosylaminoimidazole-succinocarboxamide synthase